MLRNLLIYILFFTLFSCKPVYTVIQDSYEKDDVIEVPFYVFRNCENNKVWKEPKCNTNLSDSLLPIFSETLSNYGFIINGNVRNNSIIWGDRFDGYYDHNEIDTAFIKENVTNRGRVSLIPVIHFSEQYERTYAGYNYNIYLALSLFLFENEKFIYVNSTSLNSKWIFYIEEIELDKSKIDVENLIRDVVDKALAPYIERAK